ncbi:MAG: T9SS C-terminal target domain-containing protein [Bacteroidetes bacterium]|nr:MAG: T9SS C-terminal target domain-containing protein [Bacteroidota bacterium]
MLRSLITVLICFWVLGPLRTQVLINEVMSANDLTIEDEDGDSSDWLELFNASPYAQNLMGFYLSDDPDHLNKWAVPEIMLGSQEYLLIFCSGKDRMVIGEELHTNFKIAASGETIFLSNQDGFVQELNIIALPGDYSFCAFPVGSSEFFISSSPTPGNANEISPFIHFSHDGGFFDQPFHLEIISDFNNETYEVRYSLNGDVPTMESPLYTEEILIQDRSGEPNLLSDIPCTPDYSDWTEEPTYPGWHAPDKKVAKGTVVRAALFMEGERISNVFTKSFFVFPDGFQRYSIPVISMVGETDGFFSEETGIYVPGIHLEDDNIVWSGNYYQQGEDWERLVNIEYFVEGEKVIDQPAGLRIHGGKTRSAAQKTLKLFARSEYGKKRFNFPLFIQKEQDSYKRLLFRTSMGAWGHSLLNDSYIHQASKGLNFDIQEYQPVIVFINGEYWGVHELREKIDRYKIADDHGLDPDSIQIYASWGEVLEGQPDNDFFEFRDEYLMQHDITDPGVYAYVESKLDVDNFIDYFFVECYFHNRDWPANNLKMWRSPQLDNRWRWLFFDLDGTLGADQVSKENLVELLSDVPYNNSSSEWPTIIIRTLIQNEDFKQKFINRGRQILMDYFQPDKMLTILGNMKSAYEPELSEHFDRWGNWLSVPEWHANVDKEVVQFVIQRPCEIESQMMDYFGIESFLKCDTSFIPGFRLYPNPTNGNLTLIFEKVPENVMLCRVVNAMGQILFEKDIWGSETQYFDLSSYPAGMYYFILLDKAGEEYHYAPVIKQ